MTDSGRLWRHFRACAPFAMELCIALPAWMPTANQFLGLALFNPVFIPHHTAIDRLRSYRLVQLRTVVTELCMALPGLDADDHEEAHCGVEYR